MKIITHSGNFHPDDVLAVATLLLLYPDAKVCRTRDDKTINEKDREDIVLDVGLRYEPENLYFDHHQPGGAGKRENGIPYASFGLIWKHFGSKLSGSERAAKTIEEKLVWPVDAADNGMDTYKRFRTDMKPYVLDAAIVSFIQTWEEKEQGTAFDERFMDAVKFVQPILKREVIKSNSFIKGEHKVREAYESAEDKRIIILDNAYSWKDIVKNFPEPLFVIMNDGVQTTWAVSAIKKDSVGFQNRKLLPEAWAGKTGGELAKVTGVEDANFCHNGRFLVVANSKEGAIKLAKIAVES
jgi:uncharacterized UPF0160 family protein